MAKTIEENLRDIIGGMAMQVAQLSTQLGEVAERLQAAEAKLAELDVPKLKAVPKKTE